MKIFNKQMKSKLHKLYKKIYKKNKMVNYKSFDFINYCKIIENRIEILFMQNKTSPLNNCSDLLLHDYYNKNPDIIDKTLKLKRIQMNIGMLWQFAIGNFSDFQDLGVGHPTGLDILSTRKKIIIELKNRYNTDNASSRKANFDKLAKFKKDNPEYDCIYGIINDTHPNGQIKQIMHDGIIIKYYSGNLLLKYIFGNYFNKIKKLLINNINKFINK